MSAVDQAGIARSANLSRIITSAARVVAALLGVVAALIAFAGGHNPGLWVVAAAGMVAFVVAQFPGLELASVLGVLAVLAGTVLGEGSATKAAGLGLLLLGWALGCDLAENLERQPLGRAPLPRMRAWAVQAGAVFGAGLVGAVLAVVAGGLDIRVGGAIGIALAVLAPVIGFGALALAWQYRAVPPQVDTSEMRQEAPIP